MKFIEANKFEFRTYPQGLFEVLVILNFTAYAEAA
jgi:hypothetical protein